MKIYKGKEAIQGLAVDVIDNLTTNSSTDALSAKQGVILKENVNMLSNQINEKRDYCTASIAASKTLATSSWTGYIVPMDRINATSNSTKFTLSGGNVLYKGTKQLLVQYYVYCDKNIYINANGVPVGDGGILTTGQRIAMALITPTDGQATISLSINSGAGGTITFGSSTNNFLYTGFQIFEL